jgi:hypothetical protein
MAKTGGMSKLGPMNLYADKRECACPRPLPERDADDGAVHCVACGHAIAEKTKRAAA